jgi:hypothetical protein
MGTFDSDYTAVITATLENGKTFDFADKGRFTSISYADAISDCKQIDIKDVPKSGTQKEAGDPAAPTGDGDSSSTDPEVIQVPTPDNGATKRALQFHA